jgi:hypothetical protein
VLAVDLRTMRTLRLYLAAVLAGLVVGCMAQPPSGVYGAAAPPAAESLTLKQGASARLRDGSATLTVVEVRDFSSAGCQGGPRGCADYARIRVATAESKHELQLFVAHTAAQQGQGVNRGTALGYRITLRGVTQDEASLAIDQPRQ